MFKFLRWFLVSLALVSLTACGGGSSGGNVPDKASNELVMEFEDKDNTLVLDETQTQDIIDKNIDDNDSTKVITLDSSLAQKLDNDTKILMIPSSVKFPLGYTGKIIDSKHKSDGSVELRLEDASLETLSSISMPKTTYELEKMDFVGVISPFSDAASNNKISTQRQQKVLASDRHNFNFDGKSINIKGSTTDKFKLQLSDTLALEISGKISNLKLTSNGEYKIETNFLGGQAVKVSFAEDLQLSYDSNFEIVLKGKYNKTLGYFDEQWKSLEKIAFEKYGITLKGLNSADKRGKIPIAGLVFNGAFLGGTNINGAITSAKAGGIIVWVYADISGKLELDGKLGIASNTHTDFRFKKELDKTVPEISSTITAQEDKRYLEAPFMEGRAKLTLTKGISVEADVILGGLRILNVGVDMKGELEQGIRTQQRLSYGIDNPGDSWKWSEGTVCTEGSLGAGFIAHADFAAGIIYKDKLEKNVILSFQYPKQSNIDKVASGQIGSWYKFASNKNCYDVPAPPTIINNHIEDYRQAVSAEELKNVSDDNYKYAYLSNRIYSDLPRDIEKIEDNWKTINITSNAVTGFKAGLFQNTVTDEYVISYGGTTATSLESTFGKVGDGIRDIMTDITLLSVLSMGGQPKEAIDYVKDINSRYSVSAITGHSLGGGLAQYAGLYSGLKTVTFNTAPLPFNVLGSYLLFKDIVTITKDDGLMQSVKFLYENRITNIMTVNDPVSMLSTGLMSIDESNAAYLMAVRFILAIPPIQRLDYLITGEQIYIPAPSSVTGFANHSMTTIMNIFENNTNHTLSLNPTVNGAEVVLGNVIIKDKNGNEVTPASSGWQIEDKDRNVIKGGELNEPIGELPQGEYALWVVLWLDDGRTLVDSKDIIVGEPTPQELTLELLNENECKASSSPCRFKITIPNHNKNYNGIIDFDDGTSSMFMPSSTPPPEGPGTGDSTYDFSTSEYDVKEVEYTFAQVGIYTVIVRVTVEGEAETLVSLDVVVNGIAKTTSKVKKTGQTTSYTDFDDGHYQKGVTPNYERDDAKEVVTDHITGLQWQDNAEAKTITKNWADAQVYCTSLGLDGGGWRLPTRKELVGIVDYVHAGFGDPAINAVFENTASNRYWSSTTSAGNSDSARVVLFSNGLQDGSHKTNSNYVRCVRAGQ